MVLPSCSWEICRNISVSGPDEAPLVSTGGFVSVTTTKLSQLQLAQPNLAEIASYALNFYCYSDLRLIPQSTKNFPEKHKINLLHAAISKGFHLPIKPFSSLVCRVTRKCKFLQKRLKRNIHIIPLLLLSLGTTQFPPHTCADDAQSNACCSAEPILMEKNKQTKKAGCI